MFVDWIIKHEGWSNGLAQGWVDRHYDGGRDAPSTADHPSFSSRTLEYVNKPVTCRCIKGWEALFHPLFSAPETGFFMYQSTTTLDKRNSREAQGDEF